MSNKISREAFQIAKQYWSEKLVEEQEILEGLLIDQAEALSSDIGIDMSIKIINASDNIDIAESVLNKLNNLK